jgi:hypothetical protein
MKIWYKIKAKNLFLILIFFCCCKFVSAQGFNGIIPLESTCEDVKRILQVEECKSPRSVYWLKDYTVDVSFYENKPIGIEKNLCYKVPAGRVIGISVDYYKRIPIKDFQYALKYAETLPNDISTEIYENEENGVSVFTHNGLISTAIFLPTPEQHKKFAFECQTAGK